MPKVPYYGGLLQDIVKAIEVGATKTIREYDRLTGYVRCTRDWGAKNLCGLVRITTYR